MKTHTVTGTPDVVDKVDRDALLQEAKTLRAGRRFQESLTLLKRLQDTYPRFSRLYQEYGQYYVQLGDAPSAILALQEAVRLNPTLPMSWDMLAQLYGLSGDSNNAAKATQQLTLLRQLPPEVVMANSLYTDGDLLPAETILRAYLRKDENNVGALRLLARIRKDCDAFSEAEILLKTALTIAPDFQAARLDYAMVLLHQQKYGQARHEAEHLLRQDPENRDYLKQYCAACVGLGEHDRVINVYKKLLDGRPKSTPEHFSTEVADLHLWRANALKALGRQAEAIVDYRSALTAWPDYGVAWFSLANLKTYRFTEVEIAHMRAALSHLDIPDQDQIYLCFALGKAFEDRGDYATSWQYYERGNKIRRIASRYRTDVTQACATRIKEVFTPEFFATRRGWGAEEAAPVFIVGLPRSGSTLIEQILASHSCVEGTQELTEIDRYAAELCGRDPDCRLPLNPEALRQLTAGEAKALGQRFLNETRPYRRLDRPYFIDKMPNNFWHIGLIQLILPRATIIDMRRDPMSCGFSNLKQLFGTINQEFTYSIDSVAHYYRTYLDLMRHWDEALPGRVLTLLYEDVVEDLENSVKLLLNHCRLAFEPACIVFHETRRSIRTPSSEQVRQPISREGLMQWRNYAPWLGPLQDKLGDALTQYRS